MERAQNLLAHSGDRVGSIARSVGFNDEAYFTRRFTHSFGLPPTAYRKSMRKFD
jgi:AraC-like DNA-binding protein